MVRPVINRKVGYKPEVSYFKPRGIPMTDLLEVSLTIDEREAIRLADFEGFSHDDGGQYMGVSRATFGRILRNARKNIADAIINGKAINVHGGHYEMVIPDRRLVQCLSCRHKWKENPGDKGLKSKICPLCKGSNIEKEKKRQD
ncbi:MAG: DUF134 domain-containing protein [Thermodesulfobacteriota bacterium]|nr:DUF134 domain-containing protein [Thermodesulfobacteriota bacterium]